MKKCKNCGDMVADYEKFCSSCGSKFEEEGYKTYVAGKDGDFEADDVYGNKGMAILSYLSWLLIIPLIFKNDSKYVRFHCNQGLVLALVELAWGVVEGIYFKILCPIIWPLYIAAPAIWLVNLIFVIFAIIGIVNAASGRASKLPIIGNVRILPY